MSPRSTSQSLQTRKDSIESKRPFEQIIMDADCIIAIFDMIYAYREGREKVCNECYTASQPPEKDFMYPRSVFHATVAWNHLQGHQDKLHLFCRLCDKQIACRRPMSDCQECLDHYPQNQERLEELHMVRHAPPQSYTLYCGKPRGPQQLSPRGFHLICLQQKPGVIVYGALNGEPYEECSKLLCEICYMDMDDDRDEYVIRPDYHAATALTPFINMDDVEDNDYDSDPLQILCWLCPRKLIRTRWMRDCVQCRHLNIEGTNEYPYANFIHR